MAARRAAYDEMVFRSMVRDGTPFTIRSTRLRRHADRLQVQVNSYLYGTRFMTWLGRQYSPEKVIEWVSRRSGSRATTPRSSSSCRHVDELAWPRGRRTSASPAAQSRGYPDVPRDAVYRYHDAGAGLGVARLLRSDAKRVYAALNYPGVFSTSQPSRPIPAGSRSLGHQGPTIFTGRRSRGSLRPRLVLYEGQRIVPGSRPLDPATRRSRS